ncbi:hypothetical protein OE88DRAFT_1653013 [Heliocybe sulcata]|uniref:Uncharacterized protein n=1 Tax=Heliocybe sulcata TaxID=5364 RepID=A0A5C3NCM4_9AGAM|nr:hypothetical protein OE88DRAFT_1653013 [Heliocybe sulcata]
MQEYAGSVREWLGKSVVPVVKEITRAVKERETEEEERVKEKERERERMVESLDVLVQRYDGLQSQATESDRITEFWTAADKKVSDAVNRLASDFISRPMAEPDESALIAEDLGRRIAQLGSDVEEEANQVAAIITEHRGIREEHQVLSSNAVEINAIISRVRPFSKYPDAVYYFGLIVDRGRTSSERRYPGKTGRRDRTNPRISRQPRSCPCSTASLPRRTR